MGIASCIDRKLFYAGKTIVHEWAHYRWGVFDETASDGSSPFYLNSVEKVDAVK